MGGILKAAPDPVTSSIPQYDAKHPIQGHITKDKVARKYLPGYLREAVKPRQTRENAQARPANTGADGYNHAMNPDLSIAFIGGGNMATALATGLADNICPAGNLHVVDPNAAVQDAWRQRGATAAAAPDAALRACKIWLYAVKPQQMREVVAATRSWLQPDTLIISVAAGIRAGTLADWLGEPGAPWQNLVRCMPNTPALVGAGVSGLIALPGVDAAGRALAESLLASVGQVVWVADDAGLDAVTALSGSGPAYVFLFIESLIAGGVAVGLTPDQARQLALGTLAGATKLAEQAAEPPSVLRERVTSKGGTTYAALQVFEQANLRDTVQQAMQAAAQRSRELADEFGQ
ncbi:pyrroline-5-carboxylate reductase [Bordetella tumulicola]